MNYKTTKTDDDELLLLSTAWSENIVLPNNPQQPNRPADILIPTTPSKKLPNNTDIYSLGTASPRKNDDFPNFNGDTHERLIPVQLDTSLNKKEINDNDDERALSVSSDWVSFEEHSGHNHVQTKTNILVSPKENSFVADVPARSPNKDIDWIMFDMPKVTNSSFTQQQPEDQQTTKQAPSTEQANLARQEVYPNPFNNVELDRINPFQRTSPKQSINDCQPDDTYPISTATSQISPPKAKNERIKPSTPKSPKPPSDDRQIPVAEYPEKPTNRTWSLWLRCPDLKRKLRAREWRPVVIKLNGAILQVFRDANSSAPFREVSLQCFYEVTSPKLQQFHVQKVHTVKILYVKYKEISKRMAKKSNTLYVAKTMPILKLSSTSHLVIQEFIEVVKDAIRSLPVFRDRGISHRTEAVYIDVHDTCSALLDPSGKVLMLGILVRIYLRAFISGDAECTMVLNDVHVKTQEEARLREEHMPQRVHKWINIEKCDFHNTVSPDTYNQTHCLVFQPLDACTFEVVQFNVKQLKPLPLLVTCGLIADGQGSVELRAEVKLCSDPKLAKYARKNICLYFPVPDAWVALFMTHKMFRGEKSIKSTSSQKAIKMRNKMNRPPCTIEVSTGMAQYEPEYKAVVWRIDQLPILNACTPADSSHDFTCHIQTPDSYGLPDDYNPHCAMEYEMPYTVASDTNVVNFKVSDQKIANQEVSYNAYYSYHVQVRITHLDADSHDDRWFHD